MASGLNLKAIGKHLMVVGMKLMKNKLAVLGFVNMRVIHIAVNKRSPKHAQAGVVLFFALIALVVMSLAAAALIRSVDTGNLISGNLAFKRSATISADSGTETAIAWLLAEVPANLNANNLGQAYYATSVDDPLTPLVDEGDPKALVDAAAKNAEGSGVVAGKDVSGNTITYVIQRLCNAPGTPLPDTCLFGPSKDKASFDNAGMACPNPTCSSEAGPIYRVTAKVVGPKNTVSYIQAFLS
jgi:Tfp pilus assembly protein PilX